MLPALSRAALALLLLLALPGCDLLEGDLAGWIVRRTASTQENFRASRSISVLVEPADLALYRALLPAELAMPAHPMVSISVTDNLDVGPWPLTPYQLASVSLRCAWRGEEGWHVLTMPENQWVAIWSGRTMGYPKYRAKVRLEQQGDGWTGEVRANRETRLRLDFRPDPEAAEPVWKQRGWDMGGPTINLMPPGKGPDVKVVRSKAGAPDRSRSEPGMVRVTLGAGEPWAGLVPAGREAPGTLVHWEGGRSLAPEG